MQSRWFHPPLLHGSTLGDTKRATWLELFYDLSFVGAFVQLGGLLSRDASAQGTLHFASCFLPLWVAWTGFTFFENRFTVDDFIHRALVVLQMGAVGTMAVASDAPTPGQPWHFAVGAGASQVLVALMYLRAYLQVPDARSYARYWGAMFAMGGVAWWLAAAWPPSSPTRSALLCVALSGALLVSPLSRQSQALTAQYPLDLGHLTQRYGLLTLMALGESFVQVLVAVSESTHGSSMLQQAVTALLLTAGVFWIYFDDVAGSKIRPGRIRWIIWLYAHIPLQVGITASAVALAKGLHMDSDGPAPPHLRFLLAGAYAVTYLSVAMIDAVSERAQAELGDRARVTARAASGLILLLLAAAGDAMSGQAFVLLVLLVSVAQVAFDLMVAPLVEDPLSDAGARTLADLARERRVAGVGAPPVAATADPSRAVRKGTPSELRRDLYFYFIEGSWWRVTGVFSFAFLVLNGIFAALYVLEPGSIANARPHSIVDAFFFSVQTMSTIGYGALSPGSTWGNAIVTLEAATGMVCVAVMTGLVFAKLSRPRSGIMFSRNLLLTSMNGKRVLMLRAANTRGNEVMDASVTLSVLMDEVTPEGHHFRRVRDLSLVRSRTPVFMLSWTIMHEVDTDSPLAEVDWSRPEQHVASFIATVIGHDGTYGQTTYARHNYGANDLVVNARFVDIVHTLADGRLMVDYARFHDLERDPHPPTP